MDGSPNIFPVRGYKGLLAPCKQHRACCARGYNVSHRWVGVGGGNISYGGGGQFDTSTGGEKLVFSVYALWAAAAVAALAVVWT